jgi:hypothetical protein
MDEDGFLSYMKKKKAPLRKTNAYINRIKRFEKYLSENENKESIENSTAENLEKYVEWCNEHNVNPYLEFFGIREYFRFLGSEELPYTCNQIMQMIQLQKFKLKNFLTADQESAKKLAGIGIKTASQILEAGKTITEREILASTSGVPVNEVLKFVKLANLARCPGHMKKRACLYYEAGLDTFDKIAEQDPELMIKFLDDFIKKTGFDGSAPTLADAKSSIENSKRIPRIIEF